ncbi:hypothetical protein EDC96DRAFT_520936 [Choanephora cucurbitarum]|nr:hypothetical protein EDC96DRAFT_520936 [Choanephora cucurbitarum]
MCVILGKQNQLSLFKNVNSNHSFACPFPPLFSTHLFSFYHHHMKRNLPTEIHLQILTFADKNTLLEYQLVCRNWTMPARQILYRKVSLTSYSQFQKFAETIAFHPYLGILVVALNVNDLRFTNYDDQDNGFSENYATFDLLIHHTPNMEAFCSNVGIPGSLYTAITTARQEGYWTQLRSITDPKWYNDHTHYFAALVAFRQSLTELETPIRLSCGPPSFEEWLFDSKKSEFVNLKKMCCYTGGTVSMEAIDNIMNGFPRLISVHLNLCQVYYQDIYASEIIPEMNIRTLFIEVEHLTNTLIHYICTKFPRVDDLTIHASMSSVSIGCSLSRAAINSLVVYLQSMNKFDVSFGLLENQKELVAALSRVCWQGNQRVVLTLNDNNGCLFSRVKIQVEKALLGSSYRVMKVKNPTCLKLLVQDWIIYLGLVDKLELGDTNLKTVRDISSCIDELILYCEQVKALVLSNCLINCFNSTLSQTSLSYLSLEDCVCSLEGYQAISRVFINLKHFSIIQSRPHNRHMIISMPYSSIDSFKFESDPLWHLDCFYLQVSTKSRFERYKYNNRHMAFYPRYQKATVIKVQMFCKQLKNISVSLYKSNIILDNE